jgi:hypothetical protein
MRDRGVIGTIHKQGGMLFFGNPAIQQSSGYRTNIYTGYLIVVSPMIKGIAFSTIGNWIAHFYLHALN